jgi:hypothetical protein
MNKENSGVRQKLIPIEEKILAKANSILSVFRKNGIDNSKVKEFYNWIDSDVYNEIKLKFKLN